jgi:CBS domain-containing protein
MLSAFRLAVLAGALVSVDAFAAVPCRAVTATRCSPIAAVQAATLKKSLWGKLSSLFANDHEAEGEAYLGRKIISKQEEQAWAAATPCSAEPVTKYMATNIITLTSDTSLAEAGRILTEKHITGAPVVDESGALIGVLSRHDLLYKIAGVGSLKGVREGGARSERYMENTRRLRKLEAETVGRAMTPFPVHLNPSATMQEAAALMLRRNLNRVLVTEPKTEKLLGIVSSTDVFRLAFGDSDSWNTKGAAGGLAGL